MATPPTAKRSSAGAAGRARVDDLPRNHGGGGTSDPRGEWASFGINQESTAAAVALYEAGLDKVVEVSHARVAESCKLLENIFRSVNIALVNELKVTFARMGIDVWEVIAAASTKPFGYMPFYPGPGLGGHCIPRPARGQEHGPGRGERRLRDGMRRGIPHECHGACQTDLDSKWFELALGGSDFCVIVYR
jgi:UDP-glucose/GDP-mannose dehydrogenase family, central domain